MVSPEEFRRYPYFAGASERSLETLAMTSVERSFETGQVLFEDGEFAHHLFVLTRGEVDIQYVVGVDEYCTVDTRIAGDLVVWSALVDPFRTTARGVARLPTEVLAIDARELRALAEQDHDLGYTLMKEIIAAVSHRLQGARVQLATRG